MNWIPTSERLPDNENDVLVQYEDYSMGVDCISGTAYGWELSDYPYLPIAWMPLPKPYKADRKTENSSEIPNNCEHITEDGVTCAKYPACDDCLDNPLNKLKGSERLVKGYTEKERASDDRP